MAISFSLPDHLEESLRTQLTDLDQAAKEAFLIDLYRRGKITHRQLAEILVLSRDEADGLLKRHGVFYDLTLDDVLRDADTSRRARAE